MNSCFWTDIVAAEQNCAGSPGPGPGPEGITMYTGLPEYAEPVVQVEGLGMFIAGHTNISSSVIQWGNINDTGLTNTLIAAAGGKLVGANIVYSSTPQAALLVSTDGVTLTRYDDVVPVPIQYSSTAFFMYHPARGKLYWAVRASSFYRPPGDPEIKVYEADPSTPWAWSLFQDIYLPEGAAAESEAASYIYGTGELLWLVRNNDGSSPRVLVLGATGGFALVDLNIAGGMDGWWLLRRISYAAGSGNYLIPLINDDTGFHETFVSPTLDGTFVHAGGELPPEMDLYHGWLEVPGTPYAFGFRNAPNGGCDFDTPGAGILTTDGGSIAAEITTATYVDYWDGEDWEEELYGYVGETRSAIQLGPNEWAIYVRLYQGCG